MLSTHVGVHGVQKVLSKHFSKHLKWQTLVAFCDPRGLFVEHIELNLCVPFQVTQIYGVRDVAFPNTHFGALITAPPSGQLSWYFLGGISSYWANLIPANCNFILYSTVIIIIIILMMMMVMMLIIIIIVLIYWHKHGRDWPSDESNKQKSSSRSIQGSSCRVVDKTPPFPCPPPPLPPSVSVCLLH